MRQPPPAIDRRHFLTAVGGAVLLAACGGGNDTATTPDDERSPSGADDGLAVLQAQFADGFRAPTTLAAGGMERAVFGVVGSDGLPIVNGAPDRITGELSTPAGGIIAVELPKRSAGLAAPHYPLLFEAGDAGVYELTATLAGQEQQLQFAVADSDDVPLVRIGEKMRAVDTPTFADPRGVDPICTRFEPCPFHEANLAEVIGNGRPTVLLIATPGFCQTVTCGPVVDLLIDLDPSAEMNVIHAEVYTEPDLLDEVADISELVAPTIGTYGMVFEPSLVVADAAGTVTARLDYSFDRDEMAAAVATGATG